MSKVIIDLNEFIHLKGESVYNHNYYKHKEFNYTILENYDEQQNALHFYLLNGTGNDKVFLFSCRYPDDDSKVYEGDLGFFWS